MAQPLPDTDGHEHHPTHISPRSEDSLSLTSKLIDVDGILGRVSALEQRVQNIHPFRTFDEPLTRFIVDYDDFTFTYPRHNMSRRRHRRRFNALEQRWTTIRPLLYEEQVGRTQQARSFDKLELPPEQPRSRKLVQCPNIDAKYMWDIHGRKHDRTTHSPERSANKQQPTRPTNHARSQTATSRTANPSGRPRAISKGTTS